MNCGQNPCKAFLGKGIMSKIILMLTIKACQKTSHKIDKIFLNISKQAKRISEIIETMKEYQKNQKHSEMR